MRGLVLPAAALALAAAVVLVGGRMVDRPVVIDLPDPEDIAADAAVLSMEPEQALPPETTRAVSAEPPSGDTATPAPPAKATPLQGGQPAPAEASKPTAFSRLVAPAEVAPPELVPEDLQREPPREPLSQLSLALPPKPQMKNEWAGTPFFRPLAIESAVFESGGRTIAVAGVESVPLDESCEYEGGSWPCGVRARTAFRLWLRGRALVCQLPDEERAVTPARCRLAKQDAGAWLVANGWARAASGGPYVQAEEKARAARIGIFGAPPDTSSVSDIVDVPSAMSGAPADGEPIMTEEGIDPQPSLQLEMQFPPAPPRP